MPFWMIILGLPLAVYLGVVVLPSGRTALVSCLILAGVILLAWLAFAVDFAGFAGRDDPRGAYTLLGLTGVSVALVLGASLQALRLRLPRDWPAWAWPICVVIVLVAVALTLFRAFTG